MSAIQCPNYMAFSIVNKSSATGSVRRAAVSFSSLSQKNTVGSTHFTAKTFVKTNLKSRSLKVSAAEETAKTEAKTDAAPEVPVAKEVPAPKANQGPTEEDTDFSIAKVSFGSIALTVGITFLTYGFGSFFQFLPGADISALLLIYGFPISLIGAALQYAKLDPVPCVSYKAAVALRETQATSIQKQVREDVTRYRYGDEQHLDLALDRVFRVGQGGGVSRKNIPLLSSIREEVAEGELYTLVLCFDDNCPLQEFVSRQKKIEGFFGPGVVAGLSATEGGVEVALVSDGKNAASDDDDEWIILPPLQPGLPARRARKGSV
eukprot:CAMPEP_0196581216 /NCGR_PEP_ID=MMETSP1081-20130531/32964_1 /TAXON_ID=36882 /ORGANISM="Pyramimonas amylifera, Strain CCMP720" /LENGTH=319 /DNA_ID=CAMNT_0041901355 /DNA_START=114 /DNA_END=1073 /DNA_ORIENTATION=+